MVDDDPILTEEMLRRQAAIKRTEKERAIIEFCRNEGYSPSTALEWIESVLEDENPNLGRITYNRDQRPKLTPPAFMMCEELPGFFYNGTINGIQGEAGSGKTTLAAQVVKFGLRNGHRVLYLDFENPRTTERRIWAAADGTHVGYRDGVYANLEDEHRFWHLDAVALVKKNIPRFVARFEPTLTLIDSYEFSQSTISSDGGGYTYHAGAVIDWHQALTRPLERLGSTVIVVDHSTPVDNVDKDVKATGSFIKIAQYRGTLLGLEKATSRAGTSTTNIRLVRDGGDWLTSRGYITGPGKESRFATVEWETTEERGTLYAIRPYEASSDVST